MLSGLTRSQEYKSPTGTDPLESVSGSSGGLWGFRGINWVIIKSVEVCSQACHCHHEYPRKLQK
jgi:hypothetical protein